MEITARDIQRFNEKWIPEPNSGCHLWLAALDRRGYGQFILKVGEKWIIQRAHRISYIINNGEIPEGMLIRHMCHNPYCVNPDHLKYGTYKDNMIDMVKAGRCNRTPRVKGSLCSYTNLKEDDIPIIRRRHENGETYKAIGEDYDLKERTIGDICKRVTWKHVP